MQPTARRSAEIHFGLAWNWEFDHDFLQLVDRACQLAGLSCFLVGPHNLAQTYLEVQNNERRFHYFLDRASDNDNRFLEFNRLLQSKAAHFLNAHHHYQRSIDKANIHGELLVRGLQLPLTVILPPHESEPDFDPRIIEPFAKPFVVKPARGGGGVGVSLSATLPADVVQTRSKIRNQRFLLQQRIHPQVLAGRRAWFRVYHVCGRDIPCWWDDVTHRYGVITPSERALVNTAELGRIVNVVAEVSQLDFFSTEIALDAEGRYVVVDYVNDPCDMRLQSRYFDGVPDSIIRDIVDRIVGHAKSRFVQPNPDVPPEIARLWP